MIISLPFLLATFLVYAFIQELRNLHGLALMSYLSALFVLYTSMIIIKLGTSLHESDYCEIVGYTAYASILVAFFFLNVISIDIYSTFR